MEGVKTEYYLDATLIQSALLEIANVSTDPLNAANYEEVLKETGFYEI